MKTDGAEEDLIFEHTELTVLSPSSGVLTELKRKRRRIVLEEQMEHSKEADLEALEERRDKTRTSQLMYQRKMIQPYEKLVHPRMFQESDLVLKAAEHIIMGIHAIKFTPKWEGPFKVKKFTPKWEGPFKVKKVYNSDYCILENPSSRKEIAPINFKFDILSLNPL
ncbi:reverse transcriptase [Senna tora]|uniref:Reverse transcriptase n=1 Tax=Senna tora TaxID=362788 RepID=A0A834TQG1_9FABA|nr:reverse transcriptase [Senna tora]